MKNNRNKQAKKEGGRPKGNGRPRTGGKPSNNSSKKQGACKELGSHVFDIGRGAADLLTTTWEQVIVRVGTMMGEDIQ